MQVKSMRVQGLVSTLGFSQSIDSCTGAEHEIRNVPVCRGKGEGGGYS